MPNFTYQNMKKCIRMGILLCLAILLTHHIKSLPSHASRKPDGIVVGLVFLSRQNRASSMFCYLQRNMVDRGGWIDEVLWVANTDNENDLRYLDSIQAQDPLRHKILRIPGDKLSTNTYYRAWENLERGKYYIKIDDDVVRPLPSDDDTDDHC